MESLGSRVSDNKVGQENGMKENRKKKRERKESGGEGKWRRTKNEKEVSLVPRPSLSIFAFWSWGRPGNEATMPVRRKKMEQGMEKNLDGTM